MAIPRLSANDFALRSQAWVRVADFEKHRGEPIVLQFRDDGRLRKKVVRAGANAADARGAELREHHRSS